ncbi:MAG: PAS domain-containing sensor histidine kinase [Robiginitomaculum sp.]|nr:MAG: PAS domain-containing sensor histidine kinase [Robiginitomaculum sp.]
MFCVEFLQHCDKKETMNNINKPQVRHFRTPKAFRAVLFGALFTLAAVMIGVGALMALSGDEGQAAAALPALQVNLLLIIGLGVFILLRLSRVFFRSEAGRSAPYLHRRFILIFSLAALVPAILVGLFFTALMSRNINDIFGPTVSDTMQNSREFSNAYLSEELNTNTRGVYEIANDLNRAEAQLPNRITYTAYLINQQRYRGFQVVYVVDGNGRVLAQAEAAQSPDYVLPSDEVMGRAREGSMTITSRNDIDLLVALYKLENYADAYLYTGRYLRAGVLKNIDNIDKVEAALARYSGTSRTLNKVFLLTYVEAALLIFFAAIWLSMLMANRIVTPLGEMVNAAEKVRSGNLTTRVNVSGVWDEIADLANAFNRMTLQLHTQRQDLVLEHDISEQRREFSEAVLSGVSAGVIGLTPEGKITVINTSAEHLLGIKAGEVVGSPLSSVLKGFLPAFNAAKDDIGNRADDQVNLETPYGTKNLDIRVSAYKGNQTDTGWVITFDDITRLVAAQRHSAWREVARRIAHEIKNPLTPIQLSAERLERKYKDEIRTEPDVFTSCTRTIIRQVENLGRMVDEFSAFARMPAPILQAVKLDVLLNETLFAQRVTFPDIKFEFEKTPASEIEILCDERLISQALTNIYKNAAESISRRIDGSGQDELDGVIVTEVSLDANMVCIDIADNGQGWPLLDTDRLLEPYMTTRKDGSGLGLAIVNRIAEDHGGQLELLNAVPNQAENQTGAIVRIYLPYVSGETAPTLPITHKISAEVGKAKS